MRSCKTVHVVSAHAEGEVGDVIVGGIAPPPGATLWEQSRWLARDEGLRHFLLNEPRGGVFRHVNLLVPPTDPKADAAFVVIEPVDTPPMSGSNSICVATVLLETGILPMHEPETVLTLEAPGGLIEARARCSEGRVERVVVTNHPSFADRLDARIEVAGYGTLTVDTAYGGDSFVIADASALGFTLVANEAADIARVGVAIIEAAEEQLGFTHPGNAEWSHIAVCQIAGSARRKNGILTARGAVAARPGKIDRSPCGTGCSARMAVLHTRGRLRVGEPFVAQSLLGSEFRCAITDTTSVSGHPAVIPRFSGRAWITGMHQYMLDPEDPWPGGYQLPDTWPAGQG